MTAAVPSFAAPSPVAQRLAHAGLLPFVIGALLVWLFGDSSLDEYTFITTALSAYAGLIISFLGGIHWGFAFRETAASTQTWVWGVTPALLAWLGMLMQPHAGLAFHGAVLIACYLVDRRQYPLHGAAAWLTLRFRLTAVAALSCFLAAAGS